MITRRLFLKGGLATAFVVTACGTTGLEGATSPSSTGSTATTTTEALPSGDTAVTDVMGEYSIVDEVYGSAVTVTVDGTYRYLEANGLPDHATGTFPNAGNPNRIEAQSYSVRLPLRPDVAGAATSYNVPQPFGIAVNGVPFDPFAAEWYQRDRNSGWQYEALGGGLDLGLDANNAHVQPNGSYHYHGVPSGIVPDLAAGVHSPLVGWAADGFPIYVRFGYRAPEDASSGVSELAPSYRLRAGERRSGPGGEYDGTFIEDYEYADGLGDLDESNGRYGVTPEYPDGTYHYVLTSAFPVIARSFAGTPDAGFVL